METHEIHALIDELHKKREEEHQFTVHSFISTFNILQVALGTVIAFAANKFIDDLSTEIFKPIIQRIIFDNLSEIGVLGVRFNPSKILSSFVYFIIVLIFLFLLYKYLLKQYVNRMIADERKEKIKDQRYTLNHILYQKKTYDELQKIKKLLSKDRKYILS